MGDSFVLSAMALTSSFWLYKSGCRSGALVLFFSLVTATVGIGALKLIFFICGNELHVINVRSPSGHAALSSAVFMAYGWLFATATSGWRRLATILLTSALVASISLTRIILEFHSVGEVIIGLLTGCASFSWVKIIYLRNSTLPVFDKKKLMISAFFPVIICYGWRLPAEENLHGLANEIKNYFSVCRTETAAELLHSALKRFVLSE